MIRARNDHMLIRFGSFAMYAGMAALLLYWFHGHLRPNVIFIAAAVVVYGIGGFMSPPFGRVTPLGTKQLRASVTVIGLLLMAVGFFFQFRG
jgi:hypothetical protein